MSLHWRVLLNPLSLADTRELLEVLDNLQKLVHLGTFKVTMVFRPVSSVDIKLIV